MIWPRALAVCFLPFLALGCSGSTEDRGDDSNLTAVAKSRESATEIVYPTSTWTPTEEPTPAPTSTATATPTPRIPSSTSSLSAENDPNQQANDILRADVLVYAAGIELNITAKDGFYFWEENRLADEQGYIYVQFWLRTDGAVGSKSIRLPDVTIDIRGKTGTIAKKRTDENVFDNVARVAYQTLDEGNRIYLELPRVLFGDAKTVYWRVTGAVPLKTPNCGSGGCTWHRLKSLPETLQPSPKWTFPD